MENINSKVDELISEIKQCDVYQNYQRLTAILNDNPEIKVRVDELREKNFNIQKQSAAEDMFEESIRLEDEFSEIRNNPIVNEYLDNELALCKMLKEIGIRIYNEVEIHLPF